MNIYIPLTEEEMIEMYRSDLRTYHNYRTCKPIVVPKEVIDLISEEIYLRKDSHRDCEELDKFLELLIPKENADDEGLQS